MNGHRACSWLNPVGGGLSVRAESLRGEGKAKGV